MSQHQHIMHTVMSFSLPAYCRLNVKGSFPTPKEPSNKVRSDLSANVIGSKKVLIAQHVRIQVSLYVPDSSQYVIWINAAKSGLI